MKRKILRSLWLIPLIAGICLGIAGIVKIKEANDMYVPEMGEEGWFDESSKQDKVLFTGIGMAFGGFVFLPVIAFAVMSTVKAATTTPEEEAEATAKELNKNKRFKKKLKELAGEEASKKYNYGDLYADSDVEGDDEENDEADDENLDLDEIESPYPRVKRLQKSASASNKNKTKYCEFCGSVNTGSATKCTSCGASFSKK